MVSADLHLLKSHTEHHSPDHPSLAMQQMLMLRGALVFLLICLLNTVTRSCGTFSHTPKRGISQEGGLQVPESAIFLVSLHLFATVLFSGHGVLFRFCLSSPALLSIAFSTGMTHQTAMTCFPRTSCDSRNVSVAKAVGTTPVLYLRQLGVCLPFRCEHPVRNETPSTTKSLF